jgi:predicted GNAT superfamily acetyltransferase
MIRDATLDDLPRILEINQPARPALGDLDLERLTALFHQAEHCLVVDDGGVRGFVLALGPGQPYASSNYRWFCDRYQAFCYVDRIAMDADSRGLGLGAQLYEELFRRTSDPVTCEVNVVPMNAGSLRFHERLGFVGVGEQDTEGGAKRVRLLLREPQVL